MICGPVKRSIAGEPVRARRESPNFASSAFTWASVEESIQIGAVARENTPENAETRSEAPPSAPSFASAPLQEELR